MSNGTRNTIFGGHTGHRDRKTQIENVCYMQHLMWPLADDADMSIRFWGRARILTRVISCITAIYTVIHIDVAFTFWLGTIEFSFIAVKSMGVHTLHTHTLRILCIRWLGSLWWVIIQFCWSAFFLVFDQQPWMEDEDMKSTDLIFHRWMLH